MKTFIFSVLLILSLGVSAFAYGEEDLELTPFAGIVINPISVVEVEVHYPNASEEELVTTKFISTFKGWPAKIADEIDDEKGIMY